MKEIKNTRFLHLKDINSESLKALRSKIIKNNFSEFLYPDSETADEKRILNIGINFSFNKSNFFVDIYNY